MVGTVKKSIETVVFRWFSRKVRQVCEGGFRRWTRYLLTLVSPMSMPSLRSSPWMRGAPQSGFSRLIFRISLQISFDTGGRPRWARRTFQVQNRRNPLRCHAMTVWGLTMQRAERHSSQTPQNQAHRNRSNRFSFGLFTERCSTPSWWRRVMISSCNAARVRKTASVEASNADNGGRLELTEGAQPPLYQPDLNLREAQIGKSKLCSARRGSSQTRGTSNSPEIRGTRRCPEWFRVLSDPRRRFRTL